MIFNKFYRVQIFLYVMAFVVGFIFHVVDVGRLPPGTQFYADAGLPWLAFIRVAALVTLAVCLFFPALIMLRDVPKVRSKSLRERWVAHGFLLLALALWVATFPMIILYGGTWHIVNLLLGVLAAVAAIRTYNVLFTTHDATLGLLEDEK